VFDIVSAAITTIVVTSRCVVAIITEVVSYPLGEFTGSGFLCGGWSSGAWWCFKTFTFLTILGIDIVSAAIAAIEVTSSIVVAIIAESISLPDWSFTFSLL
jgi:hypothetical protein